jgi:hypothetical protein
MNARILSITFVSLMLGFSALCHAAAHFPSIDGLYLHLDAKSLQAVDGARVTVWEDAVSGARLTGSATFVADYRNGQPGLRFDGKSDSLSTKGLTNGPDTGKMTLFMVANFTTAGNDDSSDFLVSGHHPSNANNRLRILKGKEDGKIDVLAGSGRTMANIRPADTAVHVFGLVSGVKGDQLIFMLDGAVIKSGTNGGKTDPLQGLFLGSYRGTSQYFDGTIAEVLIYNRALSQREAGQVLVYLMDRYGIQP